MAYSAPTTKTTGTLITAAIWNADVVANEIAIYAGGLSIASQAIGDILYASSTTQFARVAAVAAGQVLTSAGTGTVPAYSATPALTSVDMGGTTVYGSRAITVDTGGVLNIALASSAGDDFTVDTDKLVVSGDSGAVGIGTAAPTSTLSFGAGSTISTATADASDNDVLSIGGGGTAANSRGGSILVYGNEHGTPGNVVLEGGNVTGGDIVFRVNNAVAVTIKQSTSDVYSVPWTDYYSSSTIVGWSSLTAGRRQIMYRTLGDMVWVSFHLEGVSNATSATFTVPYTAIAIATSHSFSNALGFTYDNSVYLAPGYFLLANNDNVVKCVVAEANSSAPGWTASGSKIVEGEFWYVKA
jgi:hypothetical protein